MCQGMLCRECVLFHCCYSWLGCSLNLICCGCWLCPNATLVHMRSPEWLTCSQSGCGCSSLFVALYCCIPRYMRDYSVWCTVDNKIGDIYNIAIRRKAIVENGHQPFPSERALE